MKRVFKNRIFLAVLAIAIFTSIGVYAASMISASQVSYKGMTVEEALNTLYSKSGGGSSSTIITSLNANATVTGVAIRITAAPTATDNNKIVGYHYYIIEKNNTENVISKISTNNTISFTALKPQTEYLYYVSAYDVDNNSIKSATGEIQTESYSIIFGDKFDKYIYIDSTNGNDTSGDGTKANPYKTLDKIAENGIISNDYSYGIILNSGNYDLTNTIFTLTNNKSINIIGNKEKTILNVGNIYGNQLGGSRSYTVNIYRLVWNGKPTGPNALGIRTTLNLYNIAFKFDDTSFNVSYFYTGGSHNFYNCTLPFNTSNMLRTTNGTIQLTNCYGGFSSGYNTSQSNWDYQTNTITSNPQVDINTYRITDDDSAWKGNGTGNNDDGSTANRGVYGGTYSWDGVDDLF